MSGVRGIGRSRGAGRMGEGEEERENKGGQGENGSLSLFCKLLNWEVLQT